jgi:hypothetical protein
MFRSIAAVLGLALFLDRGSIVLKNCHDKIYYQFLERLGHFAKMSFYSGICMLNFSISGSPCSLSEWSKNELDWNTPL